MSVDATRILALGALVVAGAVGTVAGISLGRAPADQLAIAAGPVPSTCTWSTLPTATIAVGGPQVTVAGDHGVRMTNVIPLGDVGLRLVAVTWLRPEPVTSNGVTTLDTFALGRYPIVGWQAAELPVYGSGSATIPAGMSSPGQLVLAVAADSPAGGHLSGLQITYVSGGVSSTLTTDVPRVVVTSVTGHTSACAAGHFTTVSPVVP